MDLDFSSREYDFLLKHCPFTDDEKEIFDMKRHGKSVVEIAFKLHLSERAVIRRTKSLKKKILKEIEEQF